MENQNGLERNLKSSKSNNLGWGETLLSTPGKEEQARKGGKNQNFPSAADTEALTHSNSENFTKPYSNISLLFSHFRYFVLFYFHPTVT